MEPALLEERRILALMKGRKNACEGSKPLDREEDAIAEIEAIQAGRIERDPEFSQEQYRPIHFLCPYCGKWHICGPSICNPEFIIKEYETRVSIKQKLMERVSRKIHTLLEKLPPEELHRLPQEPLPYDEVIQFASLLQDISTLAFGSSPDDGRPFLEVVVRDTFLYESVESSSIVRRDRRKTKDEDLNSLEIRLLELGALLKGCQADLSHLRRREESL